MCTSIKFVLLETETDFSHPLIKKIKNIKDISFNTHNCVGVALDDFD